MPACRAALLLQLLPRRLSESRGRQRRRMALRFSPGRAIYDPRHRWVRFFARDELRLVPCAVTRKALTAAAGQAALGSDHALYIYSRVKKQVQAVASTKYHDH